MPELLIYFCRGNQGEAVAAAREAENSNEFPFSIGEEYEVRENKTKLARSTGEDTLWEVWQIWTQPEP